MKAGAVIATACTENCGAGVAHLVVSSDVYVRVCTCRVFFEVRILTGISVLASCRLSHLRSGPVAHI